MAFDWRPCDERLHSASLEAIRRFAAEHRDEPVCFFAFDAEPMDGIAEIALDTLANNIQTVKQREAFAIAQREEKLRRPGAWKGAEICLSATAFSTFNTDRPEFAYPRYAVLRFPQWEVNDFEQLLAKWPKLDDATYLESGVRLVLWRVAERLVAEEAFAALTLASPCMVACGLHDTENGILKNYVLRILNWSEDGRTTRCT